MMLGPLAPFWHRTRREAVPLTADDYARRRGAESRSDLDALVAQGLVCKSNGGSGEYATYRLTRVGEQVLSYVVGVVA